MGDNKYNVSYRGIDNLQLLFIGLKLTGYINWSWWLVLAPLWISALVLIVVGGIILVAKAWG